MELSTLEIIDSCFSLNGVTKELLTLLSTIVYSLVIVSKQLLTLLPTVVYSYIILIA